MKMLDGKTAVVTGAGRGIGRGIVLALAALEERFGVRLAGLRATTVAGALAEAAGRVPVAGERFLLGGLEFDVLEATPARVERVLVRPGPVVSQPLPQGGA